MLSSKDEGHLDRYVNELKSLGAIRSPSVEAAFRRVKRHALVESFSIGSDREKEVSDGALARMVNESSESDLEIIYSNKPLFTRFENGLPTSSSSEPALVATMIELLQLSPGMSLLEIGTGTGYNAALVSEVLGNQNNVVSIEIQDDVAAQASRLLAKAGYGDITILHRDGFWGAPERSPFDRIIATAGTDDISPHWANQLNEGGIMVLPLNQGGASPIIRISKNDGKLHGEHAGFARFMPIQGELSMQSGFHMNFDLDVSDGREFPLWPELDAPGNRYDFWFFLGMADQRTRLIDVPSPNQASGIGSWIFGLIDSNDDKVVVGNEAIHLWGANNLYRELESLYGEWVHQLPIRQLLRIEFHPVDKPLTEAKGFSWELERKYYRQVLSFG